MTLRDLMTSHVSSVFLNTDQFAEAVVYSPYNYPGRSARDDRSINAVVIREQIETVGENDSVTVLPMFEVHVANNVTTGLTGDELDMGGDRLLFPTRDGMAATYHTITRLITQDADMLVIECR